MKTNTVRRSLGFFSHLALLALASQAACLGTGDLGDDPVAAETEALYGLGALADPWPGGVVPLCWQNGLGDHPELQAKVRWILRDTWEANANIKFVGWQACSPTENAVAISFVPPMPDKNGVIQEFRGATSGLGASATAVKLMDYDDVTVTGDPSHFRYEVIHEFGHVLGFVHEQQRPDNFNPDGTSIRCPPAKGDEAQYAEQSGGTDYSSGYDASSVMHYCAFEPGTSSIFVQNPSAGDIAGIRAAYGAPTAANTNLTMDHGILWRNVQSGAIGMWQLDSGGVLLTQAFPQPSNSAVGNDWQIQGQGRFDGDGISDILWRNVNTGKLAIWFMSGGAIRYQAFLEAADRSWQIAGTGDFDKDGISDILWRNTDGSTAIWFMNGGGTVRTPAWPGRVDNSWVIQTTGDFDRDGKSDILWRNTDGSTAIWFMNGGAIRTQAWPGRVESAWVIQGAGDFDRDGYSDILWRYADGTTCIWFIKNGAISGKTYPAKVDGSWQIRGAGDLDNDGTTDILWHNTSGQVAIWFMDRGLIRDQAFPGVKAANPWRIQGVMKDLRALN